MRLFHAIKRALDGMPTGLRYVTCFCALFTCIAPLSLIPLGNGYYIGNEPVDFTEFWERGGGPAFLGIGIFFIVVTYGFLRARDWSRKLFVLAMLVLTVAVCVSSPEDRLQSLVVAAVLNALAIWYFFFRRTVRQYFRTLPRQTA